MAQVPDIDVSTVSVGGSAYTVPFVYQNRAEVFVEVDGVSTTFTWINDGNISITPAPAAGAVVRRYRSTSALEIRHDYRNGVPFTPKNIAENNDQLLFVVQEAVGTAAQSKAIADELDADITAAIAAAEAAKAVAAGALGVANGVDAKATTALNNAATALSTANTAKAIAEGIEGTALDAQTAASIASATADNAFAKALIAEETANAIDGKAQDALDAAIAAVSTAGAVDGKAQTALDNSATALSTANAAAAAVATVEQDPDFTGRITESPASTITPSGTAYTINLLSGTYQKLTNTASGATLSVSNLASNVLNQVTLEIVNGGAGAITWPAMTKWPGGTAPTLTAAGTDIVQLLNPTGAAGAWYGYLVAKDVK